MGRIWTRQPLAGTKLDWSNSLTRGMALVFLPMRNEMWDVIGNVKMSATTTEGAGDPITGVDRVGRFVSLDDTDDILATAYTISAAERPSSAVSMMVIHDAPACRGGTDQGSTEIASSAWIGGGHAYGLRNTNWSGTYDVSFRVELAGSEAGVLCRNADGATGPILTFGRWDNSLNSGNALTECYDYNTRALLGTASSGPNTGTIGYHASEQVFVVGGLDFNDQQSYLIIVWDRYLSDGEKNRLASNPWQIFKPKPRFAFADVPEDVRFGKDRNYLARRGASQLAGSPAGGA